MSENKFTPGPWFADEYGGVWRRDPKELYENGGPVAGDKPLAIVHIGWRGENMQGYPLKANACLIAAAPELLEAAQAAIAYDAAIEQSANDPAAMSSFCTATGDTLDALYEDWITKARAAIAKARGES